MKTLYLTVSSEKTVKIVFEKPVQINHIKVNKAILSLNYLNITERGHVKSGSAQRDFDPGFWSFKEIAKKFKELNVDLTLQEFSQKAVITTPSGSSITITDNIKNLLGSSTKTFPQNTTTTMTNECNILNGLQYFVLRCNEINGSFNLREDEEHRVIETNTLALFGLHSFVFVGGTQYHDGNDFTPKKLIDRTYFNELTFTLSGNNGKPVGEVFLELILA